MNEPVRHASVRDYLRLCRPKHYLKNLLLYAPLLFGGTLQSAGPVTIGFCGFSLLCSFVYLVNDLRDRESDARHPAKCSRPIASGAISPAAAKRFGSILLILAWALLWLACRMRPVALLLPLGYLILNLLYSYRLKHMPLVDVAVLSIGYLLRLLLSTGISGIAISSWLYLVVLSISLLLSFGKRLGELRQTDGSSRTVLSVYSEEFLTSCLDVSGTITIVFYALWAGSARIVTEHGDLALWSVPAAVFLYLRYRWLLSRGASGDPVDMITGDRCILILGGFFIAYLICMIACF